MTPEGCEGEWVWNGFGQNPNINIDLSSINPNDYILILGIKKLNDNSSLNLKKLVSIFGFKSSSNNASFYNQDWYYKEKFTETCLSDKWYLVQKKVIDKTRGINPESLNDKDLPSSILCAYTFFSWWLLRKELLWKNDFIWCSDQDRHGDRIYVGKYLDLDDEFGISTASDEDIDEEHGDSAISNSGFKIFNVLDIPEHLEEHPVEKMREQLKQADIVTCISEPVQEQLKRILNID